MPQISSFGAAPQPAGAGPGRPLGQATGRALALILLLAFALRMGMAIAFPAIDHPDQTYQSVEQAHRLLFGYGVLPWEFREASRSWLMPGLTGLFMGPAALVSDAPGALRLAVALGFAALSLIAVWAAYEIGRPFGRLHALIAGFGAAVWFDLVYYATKPLSETVATSALLAAFALLARHTPSRRALIWGGVALGSAFAFRYHLAPALALIAALGGGRDLRGRWLPMLSGAALPVFLLGLADWIAWGVPFASVINNLSFNLIQGGSSTYGTAHPLWYLAAFVMRWDVFAAVALVTVGPGAARKPSLLLVALIILLSHSLIAHKEYRFILPALACLAVLAALGMAELIRLAASRVPRARLVLIPAALMLWLYGTAAVALSPDGQKRLTAGRNWIDAFAALHEDDTLCGLALDAEWVDMPGLSALRRDVPVYLWETLRSDPAPASTIVRLQTKQAEPGYVRGACFAQGPWPALCLDRRAGACTPAPELTLNEELIRRGQ